MHKRLIARIPWLGLRVRVSVTLCGFRCGRTGTGYVFLGVSPVFPYHKFQSIVSPHSSNAFRFISFHWPLCWCYRRDRLASYLSTNFQFMGFIASLPSTRSYIKQELRKFILIVNWLTATAQVTIYLTNCRWMVVLSLPLDVEHLFLTCKAKTLGNSLVEDEN